VSSNSVTSKSSYNQIFKSTALIGGASVLNIFIRIIRVKVISLWLGPAGMGAMGLFSGIADIATTAAGMGISNSGVRQIAEAEGCGDTQRLARTVGAMRLASLLLGILGAVALAVLCVPVSYLTFGDTSHRLAVATLGLSVFFVVISNGQAALVQGFRRMADLARMNVLGALCGTLVGIPLVWFWGEAGIVPLLVAVSATTLLISWWFARRIPVESVDLNWRDVAVEAKELLGLGLAFMATGLMGAGVAFLNRVVISRVLGIDALGCYTAAYTLAGLYVGFILQAMGTDFFPRLSSAAKDNVAVNRMVNEQAEISLLLAVPGVLGTMVFAPWVISIFYSGEFEPAVAVLRWQALGVLGQVISWPMGFILLAKGSRRLFLTSEASGHVVHVVLLWLGVHTWGLSGAGLAFLALYLCVTLWITIMVRHESGFHWSRLNIRLASFLLPSAGVVFMATTTLPRVPGLITGGVVTLACSWYCFRALLKRLPASQLARLPRWAT
jgi:PST family polysaccharide transporter